MSVSSTDKSYAVIGAIPNWVSTALTITASSEADSTAITGTPVENLKNDLTFDKWASTSSIRRDAVLDVDFGVSRSIGSVALGAANYSKDARVRVQISDSTPAGRVRFAPTGIVSQPGFTGSLTDINDDPESPDSNSMTIDTDPPTTLTLSFATPSGWRTNSDVVHLFRARFQSTITTGTGHTVSLFLYESGTLIRTLVLDYPIAPGEDLVVEGAFAATELVNSDGSGLEFKLAAAVSASGDLSLRAADLYAAGGVPAGEYDTGLLSVFAASQAAFAAVHPTEVWTVETAFVHNVAVAGLFAHVNGRYIRLEVHDPNSADRSVRAGILMAGPALPVKVRPGLTVTTRDRSGFLRSAGDRDIPDHRRPSPHLIPSLRLNEEDAFALHRFVGLRGSAYPFSYSPSPVDPQRVVDMAIIARLAGGRGQSLRLQHIPRSKGLYDVSLNLSGLR